MLKIGFVEQVSKIMEAVHEADAERKTPLQTRLFSATVPGHVQELENKYLPPEALVIDMTVTTKDPKNARHLA